MKQGAFILILGIVLVPIWVLFLVASNGPAELAVAAVIFFLGAMLLRIAYALLFESPDPIGMPVLEKPILHGSSDPAALPPQTGVPADFYAPPAAGRWRDTNEFAQQPSVTDTTTKLLSKEENQ